MRTSKVFVQKAEVTQIILTDPEKGFHASLRYLRHGINEMYLFLSPVP